MSRIKLPGWQTAKTMHVVGHLLPHPERGIIARPEPRNAAYCLGQTVTVDLDGTRVTGQVWSQAPQRNTGRDSGRCAWLVICGRAYLLDPDTHGVYMGVYDQQRCGTILDAAAAA